MKKGRRLIIVLLLVLGLAVLAYAILFFIGSPFRKKLPALNQQATISPAILQQVTSAHQLAYLLTTANNIGELGKVYQSAALTQLAAATYRLAVQKNKHQWQWHYYLGCLQLEQGEMKDALQHFKQVVALQPGNQLARYYAGEAAIKIGSQQEGINYFRQLAFSPAGASATSADREERFLPVNAYAGFQLSRAMFMMGKTDSATLVLTDIIKRYPYFGAACRTLGQVYAQVGDSLQANKYITRANDLADYSPPADPQLDQIAEMSRSADFLIKNIEDALRAGRTQWALDRCNQALQCHPTNKKLLSIAVVENLRQGLDDKALGYLDQHFELHSKDAAALMDVTDLLYNRGHHEASLRYFNKVKQLMPGNSQLATWLFDRGKQKEAIDMINALLQQQPENVQVLSDAIRMLLTLEDEAAAQTYIQQLNQLSPKGNETITINALVAERRGDIKTALFNYKAAVGPNQREVIVFKDLIALLVKQGDWPAAFQYSQMALAAHPNEPELLDGMARLLIACPDTAIRNLNEGVEYATRAFYHVGSNMGIQLAAGKNLATAYVFLGDKKEAANYINRTIALAKKANVEGEYVAYFTKLTGRK